MMCFEDISEQRVEDVRFALGHERDIHAVCEMAVRWLHCKESNARFARSLSVKDFAALCKTIGVEANCNHALEIAATVRDGINSDCATAIRRLKDKEAGRGDE